MLLSKGRPARMAMDSLIHPADLHRALQNAGAGFTELQACYGLLEAISGQARLEVLLAALLG